MKDKDNVLRGPEIRVAVCETVGEKTLHAISYHNIFDKKGPKILRFFVAGFISMDSALCHWVAVAKSTTKPMFAPLFRPCNIKDNIYLEMKQLAEDATIGEYNMSMDGSIARQSSSCRLSG